MSYEAQTVTLHFTRQQHVSLRERRWNTRLTEFHSFGNFPELQKEESKGFD